MTLGFCSDARSHLAPDVQVTKGAGSRHSSDSCARAARRKDTDNPQPSGTDCHNEDEVSRDFRFDQPVMMRNTVWRTPPAQELTKRSGANRVSLGQEWTRKMQIPLLPRHNVSELNRYNACIQCQRMLTVMVNPIETGDPPSSRQTASQMWTVLSETLDAVPPVI